MNYWFKVTLTLAVLALSTLGMPGLAQQRYNMVLIPSATQDAFFLTMRRGARHAAQALSVSLNYQGSATPDAEAQTTLLEQLLDAPNKPDAILVAAVDPALAAAPLQALAEAGVTVIAVDRPIDDDGDTPFVTSQVASDHLDGGRLAARALAQKIDQQGHVVVISDTADGPQTALREQGFRLEMAEHFPDIELLETQYHGGDLAKIAAQIQSLLALAPEFKGVFGVTPFSALGAAQALEAVENENQVSVATFDAPTRIVEDFANGLIDIAIAQHPAEIGYFAVVAAFAAITGQTVPARIDTGLTVLDADTVSDAEYQRFIYSE